MKSRVVAGVAYLVLLLCGGAWAREPAGPTVLELSNQIERAQRLLIEQTAEKTEEARRILVEVDSRLVGIINELLAAEPSPERTAALQVAGRFRMNAVTGLATVYSRRNQHQKSVEILESLLEYLDQHGDVLGRATTLKTLGDTLQEISEPARAAGYYRRAIDLYLSDPALEDFVRYTRLAYFQSLEALGQTDEALKQLNSLVEEASLIEDEGKRQKALQQAYFSRGYFFLRLGRQARAKADLLALKELPLVKNDPAERFRAALSLLTVFQREGDISSRRTQLADAEEALKELGAEKMSPGELSLYYLSKGSMEIADENLAQGLDDLDRSDELYKASGQVGLSPAFSVRFSTYRGLGRQSELMPVLKEYLDQVEQPTLSDLNYKLTYCQVLAEGGEPDEALRLLEELRQELSRRGAKILLIDTLMATASIYDTFQLDQQSRGLYNRALALAREVGNEERRLAAEVALFRLKLRQPYYLQDKEALQRDFSELLKDSKSASAAGELSVVLTGYIRQLLDGGQLDEAETVLQHMKESVKGMSPVVDGFIVYGDSALDRGRERFDQADRHLARLAAIYNGDASWQLRRTLMGEALRWRMALKEELDEDRLLSRYQELGKRITSTEERLFDYVYRAETAGYQKKYGEQLRLLEAAEALLWSIRDSSREKAFRSAYYSTAARIYQMMVHRLVAQGRIESAFEAAERGRGQSLAALFERGDSRFAETAGPAQKEKLNELYARRDTLERELMQPDFSPDTVNRLNSVVAEIDTLLYELSGNSAASGQMNRQVAGVATIRGYLTEQQVLLRYFVGNDRSYLFVLTKNDPLRVHELPRDSELMRSIQAYRQAIERRAPEADQLRKEVSATLLGSVESLERFPEKIIVPDGPIYLVPFSSLLTPGGEPLFKSEVSVLPSAKMFARLSRSEARPAAGTEITILADPVFGEEESSESDPVRRSPAEVFRGAPAPLPGTLKEAKLVRDIVGDSAEVDLYLGVLASRDQLMKLNDSGALKRSKIVHFATHGFTVPSDPRLSGLVLSLVDPKGEPSNGYLRLVDIYRLNLDADLVVLSACQTGLGTIRAGDGLQGLYQGFLMAGSRRVLNTLWSVDDTATTEFMGYFYRALTDGRSPKAALSLAQGTMASTPRWSDPFYWAGFQLVSP